MFRYVEAPQKHSERKQFYIYKQSVLPQEYSNYIIY